MVQTVPGIAHALYGFVEDHNLWDAAKTLKNLKNAYFRGKRQEINKLSTSLWFPAHILTHFFLVIFSRLFSIHLKSSYPKEKSSSSNSSCSPHIVTRTNIHSDFCWKRTEAFLTPLSPWPSHPNNDQYSQICIPKQLSHPLILLYSYVQESRPTHSISHLFTHCLCNRSWLQLKTPP